ncbi:MAG TPA: hypothetical protein VFT71_06180 [Candidatus Nitrosocosmicus sp.]|nr:hypothetical protein [Candidatus Nitrosocosmicus sp.]
MKPNHRIHPSYEKSGIERIIYYIKDRTESFDDYFSYMLKNYKAKQVKNWSNLFVDYRNRELLTAS